MAVRVEVTTKYAQAYVRASKKQKGQILDTVVGVTGWDRDHARQQLRRRGRQPPGRVQATVAVLDRRRRKPRKYSYDATKVVQRVWAVSGGGCGKSLAACLGEWLDAMERCGQLIPGQDRYSPTVRAELWATSAATMDRYLAPARAQHRVRGKSTTKPGALLPDEPQHVGHINVLRRFGDHGEKHLQIEGLRDQRVRAHRAAVNPRYSSTSGSLNWGG